MKKIVYLTNIERRLALMRKSLLIVQKEETEACSYQCLDIGSVNNWTPEWEDILFGASLVAVKWMGSGLDTPFLKKMTDKLRASGQAYYIDAAGTDEGELVQGVTAEQIKTIKLYTLYAGMDNFLNLWRYLGKEFGGLEGANCCLPDARYWTGIFHPRAQDVYTDLAAYRHAFCREAVPAIGVLFYRDEWVWGDLAYQSRLVEEIERAGMNAVCVFANGTPTPGLDMPTLDEVFQRYFFAGDRAVVDTIINCFKFSLTALRSLSLATIEKLNVPILQGYTLLQEWQTWQESLEGMTPMEVSLSLTLPEFDGSLHGVPLAAKTRTDDGLVEFVPLGERIVRMVGKAQKWAMLRHKTNAEKKIAVIFHNYPPTNSNIGSALGLDSIESVRRLLKVMAAQGYKLENVPEDGRAFMKMLTAQATNDRSMLSDSVVKNAYKFSGKEYQKLYASLPEKTRGQLQRDWGEAPGKIMNYDGDLLVPGTLFGNVLVTVQPPRGFGEDPSKIYHSPFTAPTHQYLAFYRWLRDEWQADAVVHVGTHGSLEWLPGKNAGLDASDYPDIALTNLPNVYPYMMTITGEGTQAKRRSSACLIEHLPPPQARSGVYEELEELEKLAEEYNHFAFNQSEKLPTVQGLILKKTAEANLREEVPYDEKADFGEYVAALHNYLSTLKNMVCKTGLHILGEAPYGEHLSEYLELLVCLDNGEIPSLHKALAHRYDVDYNELLEQGSKIFEPPARTYAALLDEIALDCRRIMETLAADNFSPETAKRIAADPLVNGGNDEVRALLVQVLTYLCGTV